MNQLNRYDSITKSASASTKPSSPTFNGYAHFAKFNIPQLSDSSAFVKPPHMGSPDYLKYHAAKPTTEHKFIALNDLEEPIKMTILSDIERDQRLNAIKQKIDQDQTRATEKYAEIDRKRKADHSAFDSFVKKSGKDLSDLQLRYNDLFGRYTNLQNKYGELIEKNADKDIIISNCEFENNRLNTLLTMKDQEIADLKETVELYTPRSPPDIAELANIMDPPELDLKRSADDFQDFTYNGNPFIDLNQNDQPFNAFPTSQLTQPDNRVYTKKVLKLVTDPVVLFALHSMARNIYSYSRKPFQGVDFNGVRYAFYFGKINKGAMIGLVTNIVLSSERKVYNISNIDAIVEMSWNEDITSRGKKRGFGHIYLGTVTGSKGFETNICDMFKTELGLIL